MLLGAGAGGGGGTGAGLAGGLGATGNLMLTNRRRRSLSQSQLVDLGSVPVPRGASPLSLALPLPLRLHQGLFGKASQPRPGMFDAPNGVSQASHGTSAGYCTICKKLVSNRTNHKYVHSQSLFYRHCVETGVPCKDRRHGHPSSGLFYSNQGRAVSLDGKVKFRCKLCGYLYSRKDTLKDHIRGKHNPCYSTTDLNSLVEVVPPAPSSPSGLATIVDNLVKASAGSVAVTVAAASVDDNA